MKHKPKQVSLEQVKAWLLEADYPEGLNDGDMSYHTWQIIKAYDRALQVAISSLRYAVGPTRDVKTPMLKYTLKQIEDIMRGHYHESTHSRRSTI